MYGDFTARHRTDIERFTEDIVRSYAGYSTRYRNRYRTTAYFELSVSYDFVQLVHLTGAGSLSVKGIVRFDDRYTVGGRSETNFLGFNSVLSDSFGTFCPFGRGLKPGPENDPTQNWAENHRGTPLAHLAQK